MFAGISLLMILSKIVVSVWTEVCALFISDISLSLLSSDAIPLAFPGPESFFAGLKSDDGIAVGFEEVQMALDCEAFLKGEKSKQT